MPIVHFHPLLLHHCQHPTSSSQLALLILQMMSNSAHLVAAGIMKIFVNTLFLNAPNAQLV